MQAAARLLLSVPPEISDRAGLSHPWATVPVRRLLAGDLQGLGPTRSQTNQFDIQGHFSRNGVERRLGAGHPGVGDWGLNIPSPMERDQQQSLTSTGDSSMSGPSHLTTSQSPFHSVSAFHMMKLRLRKAKQHAPGHTAGNPPSRHQNPGLSVQPFSLR